MTVGNYGTRLSSGAVALVAEHTATSVGNKIYVLGGNDYDPGEYSTHSDRFRVLDPLQNACYEPVCPGPRPCGRRGHAACLVNDKLFIIGGKLEAFALANEEHTVWSFDVVLQEWRMVGSKLEPFRNLREMSANFMRGRNEIIVFGGRIGRSLKDDLYALEVDSYRLRKPPASGVSPEKRRCHMSCSSDNSIFIFGGSNNIGGNTTLDTRVFVLSSLKRGRLQWSTADVFAKIRPGPRYWGSCVMMNERLIIFGGTEGVVRNYGDLWAFSLREHTWKRLEWVYRWSAGQHMVLSHLAGSRYAHTANIVGDELLVLGGFPVNEKSIRIALNVVYPV